MLEKLDNNEAVLLMYLAEELPAEDRAEIERMLAGDESLRGQLAMLRLAEETTERALRSLDAAAPARGRSALGPGSPGEAAVIRRINRSMRSHLTRKIAERPAPAAKRGPRIPWWCYPTAATAASVLAFLVWYGASSPSSPINFPPEKPQNLDSPLAINRDSPKVKELQQFWGPVDDSAQAQQEQIAEGVRQLAALPNGGDDVAVVWNIDGTAGNTSSGADQTHE